MAQYKLLKKWFGAESGTTAARQYNPGEIGNVDFPAPEWMQPVGAGPHNVEARRFDIPGLEEAPLLKRAEIAGTPLLNVT